ncbi:MAG: Gfo/Idh/MocA family oxidoreductase [Spirochaetales bacterium]|nr:Gfo/Idh/MocA family oxidoreductase [Spirochaetales bacterium]
MINVGIVGIGFMGMIHYLAYRQVKETRVKAVVSRSPKKRAGDWRGIKGNFGPEGTMMDLGDVDCYESLDQLLDDPQVDLVDVCLPAVLHADASVRAMRAGKHVLCEKPISISIRDAERMVETAQETQRLLMIAQVLPFFPEYDYVRRTAGQGTYGRLWGGSFKRVIADPIRVSEYFDPSVVGGPLIDLHIHDAHFIRLLCGMPERVYSRGRMRGDVVEFATTDFLFGGGHAPLITAAGGVIGQQGRPFNQAFELYFEDATVLYDYFTLDGGAGPSLPLTVLTRDGGILRPGSSSGGPLDAFVAELAEAAAAVENGSPSPLLDGKTARDALLLCYRQTESVRTGRFVEV